MGKNFTHFSSTWRLGGHFIASHVFHCTCRTLYTCPNPPDPIFSQLSNSDESKVFSSPITPGEFSWTSILKTTKSMLMFLLLSSLHKDCNWLTHLSASLFFFLFLFRQLLSGPSLCSGEGWVELQLVTSLPVQSSMKQHQFKEFYPLLIQCS